MVIQLLIALVLAVAALAGGRLIVKELRAFRADTGEELTSRSAEVDRRLLAIDEKLDRRLADLDTKVDRRLESASKQSVAIHEQLDEGRRDDGPGAGAGQGIRPARAGAPPAQGTRRLRRATPREPAARPASARLVPAPVQLRERRARRRDPRVDRLVPIDAKFPLDNFERLAAAESDEERLLFEKAFARDLKGHVDAISSKYIRPDEGTYDFALMYLPAESVYYELVCGKTGSLLQYAHEKRVFPVSPTTFTAQLQVIALGLKGLQIEQHAHEVMAYVAQLGNDFDRFKADFDVVGKHIGNAQSKYSEAERRLDRFEAKLERASDQEELEAEQLDLPRALDAA